jgi:hypothetical protein
MEVGAPSLDRNSNRHALDQENKVLGDERTGAEVWMLVQVGSFEASKFGAGRGEDNAAVPPPRPPDSQ